jgi:hypothetical protein
MHTKPIISYSYFICTFVLSACVDSGAVVEYYPVLGTRTAAVGAKISPESVVRYKGPAPTDRPGVTVIGTSEVFVTNRMKRERVIRQIKEVAAAHGANAVFLRLSNVNTSLVPYYIPPVTADMPKTSYTSASSQIYSPYSGYVGSVNTTGTTTTMEPTQIMPGMSGVARVQTGTLHVQFAVINTR